MPFDLQVSHRPTISTEAPVMSRYTYPAVIHTSITITTQTMGMATQLRATTILLRRRHLNRLCTKRKLRQVSAKVQSRQ